MAAGDQRHAGRGMAGLGDPRIHLVRRKLAALTGFGTLGHLDLNVGGIDQMVAGDAEPARRHLLDGAAPLRIVEAVGILTALPEFERAPIRFIAIAIVSCASAEIEP